MAFFIPRSVNNKAVIMHAFSFVRSMSLNTRNVKDINRHPNRPKTPHFGPTDIACLPGPKIHEILEISSRSV